MYNTQMLNYIKKIIAGIAIGIANVIPGVSGGTIAVVFGVYPDLIGAASLDIKTIKINLKSYLCLFGGVALGVLLFARLFKLVYERFPVQTNFFFIGLILGSIFIIFEFVREKEQKSSLKTMAKIIWFFIGLGLMLALYFFKGAAVSSNSAIETLNLGNFFLLFFAGFAGAAAMVIPGVSGSFLLLIMGVYYSVIKAITDFNIPILIPVGLGILAGIFFSARLIGFLMERFPKITYAFILGLVLGSVRHMLPDS
ncbi:MULTISPECIES: DUF368 domain-containing protein [unclassified Treponema]|uniref:DUF368 domain-containing protein n=1 Tax=unclassified Treponema TaxID=2638727 RepID=UPI0020A2472A|nr:MULTISPECIES: DUF368 domain-containing protein [unclassified Treponema]UTC66040.1 DUF368 domain-containing protein [Treponema sp. OMZ 789]UTC68770.1 DUF368 domain-containing protein [Treponema sp. OMZ 790]UTC71499.1 DUF368 domain-containing protein [Treponema sp. OMZ 791]